MTLKLSTLPGQLFGGSKRAGRGRRGENTEAGALATLPWWLSRREFQLPFSIPLLSPGPCWMPTSLPWLRFTSLFQVFRELEQQRRGEALRPSKTPRDQITALF